MELLYTSKYYASYQSTKDRCFYIDFGHKMVKVSFCQLLSLRYKAKQLSTSQHLEYMVNHSDVTLLTFCDKEHMIVLDTLQVLDFTELIQATFTMLELNNVLSTAI
ncbi:hypothetical protein M0D21_03540 [Aquimarina sp. D1M17]|uniref:hypothetical protein n=1 Tax=Aquimarina acroporae TaxID=2937283 RepID=UPI0020BE344A|nr:hypothetical protein [Aquimarina acroporae]MCK8520625.1 hypothetical protein [Aquimarina acroporae]